MSLSFAFTFLPPFAPRPLRRFPATMKALTSRLRHHSADGISLIHTARASDRSASKHLMTFRRRFLTLCLSASDFPLGPFPVRVHWVSRLRHWAAGSPDHPVESSSSRADRSFAFRCSPPRLTATQLRSALVNERLTRGDFHSSAQACFQAHGPAAELPTMSQESRRHAGRISLSRRFSLVAAAVAPHRSWRVKPAAAYTKDVGPIPVTRS